MASSVAVVAVALVVIVRVQVEADEGFAGDGRLVLLHQQPPGAGGGRPVDAAGRIAALIVAHAHHARRVLEQGRTGRQRHQRRVRGQAQAAQGDHPRVDDDVSGVRPLSGCGVTIPKQVPGLQRQWADRIVAPLAAVERVMKATSCTRTQGSHLAVEGRRGELHRQRLVHFQPGNGQPAVVVAPSHPPAPGRRRRRGL